MSEPSVKHSDPRPPAEIHYGRAPRSWRSRFRADYRHWVRRTFSRESFVNSLKALLWVVPLTALVWSYAFNEELITPKLSVNLTFQKEADRVVRFAPGEPQRVEADVEGPQKAVTNFEDDLRMRPVSLDLDRSLPTGRHSIDLKTVLNRDSRFTTAGVTVQSVNPGEITVDIDSIAERSVEVRVPPDVPTGVLVTFNTAKVKIFGPSKELNQVGFVYANLKPFSAVLTTPGKHPLEAIPLELPEGLSSSPATIAGTVDGSGNEETLPLDSISVCTTVPAQSVADKYQVVYDPQITKVKLVGPKKTIDEIRGGVIVQPYAAFLVDYSNPTVQHTADLTFPNLPPGVQVQGAPTDYKYTLVPRNKDSKDQ